MIRNRKLPNAILLLLLLLATSFPRLSVAFEEAGVTIPGTTEYPDGGMKTILPATTYDLFTGSFKTFGDAGRGVVNVISNSGQETLVHRLSASDLSIEEVGDLSSAGVDFKSVAFDPVGNSLFYVRNSAIRRVDLADYSWSQLATIPGQHPPDFFALLDVAGRMAHFFDASLASMTHLNLETLDAETTQHNPSSSARIYAEQPDSIDELNGFGYAPIYYIPTFDFPAIMKFDLKSEAAPIFKANFSALLSPSPNISVDPARGFGYYYDSPSQMLIRCSLADLSTLAFIPIPRMADVFVDRPSGEVFVSLDGGNILRVGLDPFAITEEFAPDHPAPLGEDLSKLSDGRILATTQYYFGGRIRIYDTVPSLHVSAEQVLVQTESRPSLVIADEARESQIVVYGSDPASASKFKFGPWTWGHVYPTDQVIWPGVGQILCGVQNSVTRTGYFATATSPAQIISVDLNSMEILDTITLETGEDTPICAVIDESGGFAYFGTLTSPGRIVRVALDPLARVDAVELAAGEDLPRALLYDSVANELVVGLFTLPAKVVTLKASDFSRVATSTFDPGEQEITCGAIDSARRKAVFGTGTDPARVLSLNLDSHEVAESLVLDNERRFANSIAIDQESGDAFLLTPNEPSRLTKFSFDPLRERGVAETGVEGGSMLSFYGGRGAFVWGADSPEERRRFEVSRITTSYDGVVSRIKVHVVNDIVTDSMNFFSHEADGNLWFAIQTPDTFDIPWSAGPIPNTVDGGEIIVPVSSNGGGPLVLPAGDYWLVWSTDSSKDVAGFAGSFGFEATLGYPGASNLTNQEWPLLDPIFPSDEVFSIHLNFHGSSDSANWELYE